MPTLETLHDYHVSDLDPTVADSREASAVAVGTDGTAVAVTDSGLGSELLRVGLVETSSDGRTLSLRAFVDSTQGNGSTIREAGAVDDGGAVVAAEALASADYVDKDSATTLTIDIDIGYQDVSEA